MKLFKLPVTGGVLVGINEKVNDSTYKYDKYYLYELQGDYYVFDANGQPTINPFPFTGPLSDVTEEQAREWGFGEKWDFDSEVYFQLTQGLHHFPDMHTAFSNILLILIKDE